VVLPYGGIGTRLRPRRALIGGMRFMPDARRYQLARISHQLARADESQSVPLVQTPRRPCWLPGQEAFVQGARFGAVSACQASSITDCYREQIMVYASIAQSQTHIWERTGEKCGLAPRIRALPAAELESTLRPLPGG